MTRHDFSFAFALCLSLLLHIMLLGTAAELYRIRTPGGHSALAQLFAIEPPPAPPHHSPLEDEDVDERDPTQRIGEAGGTGLAIMPSAGDMPLQAPKASQDQPFLSRDPVGAGKVGDDPTDSVLPTGKSGESAAEQLAAAMPPPRPPAPPTPSYLGATNSQPDFAAPFKPAPPQPEPIPNQPESMSVQQQPAQPKKEQEPTAPQQIPQQQEPTPRDTLALAANIQTPPPMPPTPPAPPAPRVAKPSPPSPAQEPGAQPGASSSADPAPMADSEIDPVSTVGSVDFRAGSANVRLGRKTKLTRPRLSLAAQTDLMTMRTAAVILRIKIDPSGKVLSAEVARSSGNPAIDQPCKLAAYDWWFEPLKDNLGRPTKDVIMFAIRFI